MKKSQVMVSSHATSEVIKVDYDTIIITGKYIYFGQLTKVEKHPVKGSEKMKSS